MQITEHPKGLTVRELKAIIKDWPELDSDGDPTEVWIETGFCMSSIVTTVAPLNLRGEGDAQWAHMILESSAFERHADSPATKYRNQQEEKELAAKS